ncbi:MULTISPECIES: AAA family ATPase [Ruminococcus]|uniref:Cytidylate kinase n=1 Tax=Ruminococcus albus (strain ATCC 27210 / DSM 20455 / JCM 14654 / NCDO 2250 / 7) TaxID=697329 RepID=E6UKE3_RUMA7|nr:MULTISPECIES: cytidylate kinase-like family protein [Ruminococcus]ADU24139.1 cytidylate kinase [Ruminococcus albus 7 = DSM 20455]MCR5021247.1 cytidylate kinase-like family protein [Ruminococcus sp.]
MSQIIISIGREFGSGGRVIAQQLADKFGLPLYDRHLITEIAQRMGMTPEEVEKYNEVPKIKILSRTVKGYSNSIEDNIAEMQFDIIDQKANSGESFVVVGRCSETKLKKYPALVSLFILGDMEKKIERVMEVYELSREDAERFILKKDKKRKRYHNYHVQGKWGDSRLYDLSVNSSKLGIDKTADMLADYIRARMAENEK